MQDKSTFGRVAPLLGVLTGHVGGISAADQVVIKPNGVAIAVMMGRWVIELVLDLATVAASI